MAGYERGYRNSLEAIAVRSEGCEAGGVVPRGLPFYPSGLWGYGGGCAEHTG